MLTQGQKDLLVELMPALAREGVSRAVFGAMLDVANNVMARKAKDAGIRFSDYPPATPGEMRSVLSEAGFPIDDIDAAIDAVGRRRMRGVPSPKAARAAKELATGENLYALIRQHRPIKVICDSTGATAEQIADFLRENELWPLLRTFNALSSTVGAARSV